MFEANTLVPNMTVGEAIGERAPDDIPAIRAIVVRAQRWNSSALYYNAGQVESPLVRSGASAIPSVGPPR